MARQDEGNKIASCGGFLYDSNFFMMLDGIFTLDMGQSEVPSEYFISSCGGIKFDSTVFYQQNRVIGLKDTEDGSEFPITGSVRANCSLLFDSGVFGINEEGGLTIVNNPQPRSLDDNPDIEDDEHTEEHDPEDF